MSSEPVASLCDDRNRNRRKKLHMTFVDPDPVGPT